MQGLRPVKKKETYYCKSKARGLWKPFYTEVTQRPKPVNIIYKNPAVFKIQFTSTAVAGKLFIELGLYPQQ